jgi:hypothetical protein
MSGTHRPNDPAPSLRKAALALAASHLMLVATGAARLYPLTKVRHVDKGLQLYGRLSGADCSFGFFAPSVASAVRVDFSLTGASGENWTDSLETGLGEVDQRICCIRGMFFNSDHRALAASWAAKMFGRHPSAVTVEVRVSLQDLPAPETYRCGERPRWRAVYAATFRRGTTTTKPNGTGELP